MKDTPEEQKDHQDEEAALEQAFEKTVAPLITSHEQVRAAEIIEAWFKSNFTNNWCSQNTEIYNRLYTAKLDLLNRFKS